MKILKILLISVTISIVCFIAGFGGTAYLEVKYTRGYTVQLIDIPNFILMRPYQRPSFPIPTTPSEETTNRNVSN
jgi:hypothetical protein